MMKDGDTILVEGRYSGLGVLSPARTKALSIYMLHVQYTTDRALKRVAEFYSEPANRPDVVVIYKDDTGVFTIHSGNIRQSGTIRPPRSLLRGYRHTIPE